MYDIIIIRNLEFYTIKTELTICLIEFITV
jgi:hypothetical protein